MKIRAVVFCICISGCAHAQGEFTQVTAEGNGAIRTQSPGFYKGAAWVDIDNDNDVDLFVSPNFLFRNDGKGTFVAVSDAFAFKAMQPPGGASWADINNDGFIDCIISQNPSGVFLSNGNFTFTNISAQISGFDSFASWGCAFGNWNN